MTTNTRGITFRCCACKQPRHGVPTRMIRDLEVQVTGGICDSCLKLIRSGNDAIQQKARRRLVDHPTDFMIDPDTGCSIFNWLLARAVADESGIDQKSIAVTRDPASGQGEILEWFAANLERKHRLGRVSPVVSRNWHFALPKDPTAVYVTPVQLSVVSPPVVTEGLPMAWPKVLDPTLVNEVHAKALFDLSLRMGDLIHQGALRVKINYIAERIHRCLGKAIKDVGDCVGYEVVMR